MVFNLLLSVITNIICYQQVFHFHLIRNFASMISLCKDVLAQGIETFIGIFTFLFPQIRFYLNTGIQICGIQVL